MSDITPDVIAALATLRNEVRYYAGSDLRDAFDILDNAGIFAEIDEVAGSEETLVQIGSEEWHRRMGRALAETPLYANRRKCTCIDYVGHGYHQIMCPGNTTNTTR